MSRLRVVLDVQHVRRPDHPRDRGARFAIPRELVTTYGGRTHINESELVEIYVLEARAALELAGAQVITDLWGTYPTRAESAHKGGAGAYLACHLNAGGGRYALASTYGPSATTPAFRLATALLVELAKVPGVRGGQRGKLGPIGLVHRPGDRHPTRFERGSVCIRRAHELGIPAVLVEPMFGDAPNAGEMLAPAALARVGGAIAAALTAWHRTIA